MGSNLIKYIVVLTIITFLGCVATAKLTDLPSSSTFIDFDKYSKELDRSKSPFWTLKSSNEYYFERPSQISENKLIEIIAQGLLKKGYRIEIKDKINVTV